MASVSSDASAPRNVVSPSASAAHTIARLVIDFDPGGDATASMGPSKGSTS